jgi:hypothetical protein
MNSPPGASGSVTLNAKLFVSSGGLAMKVWEKCLLHHNVYSEGMLLPSLNAPLFNFIFLYLQLYKSYFYIKNLKVLLAKGLTYDRMYSNNHDYRFKGKR